MSSTYKVDSDVGVNVRDTPNGNRVGGLMNGTQVTKLDDDPVDAGGHVWVKVSSNDPSITGWVASDFLTEVSDKKKKRPKNKNKGKGDSGASNGSDDDLRQRILAAAKSREGTPYRMPPDGVTNLDCSLFIVKTFADAGDPLPGTTRTAQQIRQVCTPIDNSEVKPGDLIFFQNTYPAGENVASHVGISLGAGSGQMWDCHAFPGESGPPGVGLTNVSTSYWQEHWLEVRRPPGLS
jgi:cell wall-associated NlpC family hydrolase